jgi:hypothetical protein
LECSTLSLISSQTINSFLMLLLLGSRIATLEESIKSTTNLKEAMLNLLKAKSSTNLKVLLDLLDLLALLVLLVLLVLLALLLLLEMEPMLLLLKVLLVLLVLLLPLLQMELTMPLLEMEPIMLLMDQPMLLPTLQATPLKQKRSTKLS